MALNSSGAISLAGSTTGQSIALELGQSGSGTISLNDTNVRTLAGVTGSGTTIAMPTNFYGKSNITLAFSPNIVFETRGQIEGNNSGVGWYYAFGYSTIGSNYVNAPSVYVDSFPSTWSNATSLSQASGYEISILYSTATENGTNQPNMDNYQRLSIGISPSFSTVTVGNQSAYYNLGSSPVIRWLGTSPVLDKIYTATGTIYIRSTGGSPSISKTFTMEMEYLGLM
jgi:hypothetical protein